MALWGDARTRGNFYRLGRQVPWSEPRETPRPVDRSHSRLSFLHPHHPAAASPEAAAGASRRAWPAAALALGALLTACGGGGSDGAAPPPALVPPSAPVPRRLPPSPSFPSVPANRPSSAGDEATVTVNGADDGFAEAVQLAAQELPEAYRPGP